MEVKAQQRVNYLIPCKNFAKPLHSNDVRIRHCGERRSSRAKSRLQPYFYCQGATAGLTCKPSLFVSSGGDNRGPRGPMEVV
jgi:hypothetical protein